MHSSTPILLAAVPAASPSAPRRFTTEGFSLRELEVLRLVVADYSNQEIADQLFLAVRTVETHRRNLLQKAGTRSIIGLVVRALREGWVS